MCVLSLGQSRALVAYAKKHKIQPAPCYSVEKLQEWATSWISTMALANV